MSYGSISEWVKKDITAQDELSRENTVNAKQKWHLHCETEMSCFVSENAFDRLAIYFRAFSFPNGNHENNNLLVYDLIYKTIA